MRFRFSTPIIRIGCTMWWRRILLTRRWQPVRGDDFRRAISSSWWQAVEAHQPDLILISAGFDAHQDDPLAHINLDEGDFAWVTEEITALAVQFSQGRIVSTLEGGYDLQALADSTLAHLEVLAA